MSSVQLDTESGALGSGHPSLSKSEQNFKIRNNATDRLRFDYNNNKIQFKKMTFTASLLH